MRYSLRRGSPRGSVFASLWHVYSEPANRPVTELALERSSCFNNVVLELGDFLTEDLHRETSHRITDE